LFLLSHHCPKKNQNQGILYRLKGPVSIAQSWLHADLPLFPDLGKAGSDFCSFAPFGDAKSTLGIPQFQGLEFSGGFLPFPAVTASHSQASLASLGSNAWKTRPLKFQPLETSLR